jgi:hypothetical protein
VESNLLGACSWPDHGPRRYEEQVERINADDAVRKEAPRFGPWQDAGHKHPRYCEEYCNAKVAEAFVERPSASSKFRMEEHNGERRYAPETLYR